VACELTRARSAWELRQRTNPKQARASADTTKLTAQVPCRATHHTDADHAEVVPPFQTKKNPPETGGLLKCNLLTI